jgi:type II secretory pathway pseudopilin PulG
VSQDAHHPRRAAEAGFSLIQMLVVLIITAVLMALVASPIRGARRDGQRRSAIAAARTIAEAADRFRLDHGERPPVLGNSKDWPNAEAGPFNFLTQKSYMKTRPDVLGASWLGFGTTVTNPTQWSLVYRGKTQPPYGFRIDVVYHNSAATPSCTIAIDSAPASPMGSAIKPC